jgi:hypothetical protein
MEFERRNMRIIEDTTLVSKTLRYELTEEASLLVGHGTPYPMAPAEDKIKLLKGVSDVQVVRWGEPLVIDVTIDRELASEYGRSFEQVEDHIRTLLHNHCDDYARLTKYACENGIYPHHEKLIVSDDDYIVLQNRNDKSFTVCYENGADVARVKVEHDDYLIETLQEIVEQSGNDYTFVSRGDQVIEHWASRNRRGMSLR